MGKNHLVMSGYDYGKYIRRSDKYIYMQKSGCFCVMS